MLVAAERAPGFPRPRREFLQIEILTRLGFATSRAEQLKIIDLAIKERTVIAALDVAVAPVLMPRNVLHTSGQRKSHRAVR